MNKNLIATILLVANVVCAVSLLLEVPSILKTKRTYVLTPFMKVVPENTEWTMQELEKMHDLGIASSVNTYSISLPICATSLYHFLLSTFYLRTCFLDDRRHIVTGCVHIYIWYT